MRQGLFPYQENSHQAFPGKDVFADRNIPVTLICPGYPPIIIVMNTASHALPSSVSDSLSRIRELYMSYFDRSELTSALRDFPMENRQYQDIRHALSLNNPTVWDLPVLHRGLSALKDYIRLLRLFVLPRSNQKLGFSFLGAPGFKENNDTRIQRRLMLYALPLNMDRLTLLVRELEENLPAIPTAMPSLRSGFPTAAAVRT